MTVARHTSLQRLDGYAFPVLYSVRAEVQARKYAQRVSAAHAFLNEILGITPELRLLTLSEDDWQAHAAFPMYGMPHTARGNDIIVGTALAEFWNLVAEMIKAASTPEEWAEVVEIHGVLDGGLDFTAFNDLLPIHELGHLYHEQASFRFPRLWLMELFANLCVHVYLDALEPAQMPVWTSLCEQLTSAPLDQIQHHSLADFERLYVGVGADNYVWYQFRFVVGIMGIYTAGDVGLLQRLYQFGKDAPVDLSDEQLADLLEERGHPWLARFMRDWPA